jgi:hypothetical protein
VAPFFQICAPGFLQQLKARREDAARPKEFQEKLFEAS